MFFFFCQLQVKNTVKNKNISNQASDNAVQKAIAFFNQPLPVISGEIIFAEDQLQPLNKFTQHFGTYGSDLVTWLNILKVQNQLSSGEKKIQTRAICFFGQCLILIENKFMKCQIFAVECDLAENVARNAK